MKELEGVGKDGVVYANPLMQAVTVDTDDFISIRSIVC